MIVLEGIRKEKDFLCVVADAVHALLLSPHHSLLLSMKMVHTCSSPPVSLISSYAQGRWEVPDSEYTGIILQSMAQEDKSRVYFPGVPAGLNPS